MMRALVFDLDGLILDTETPDFQSWQEIFQAHGCTLPFSTWQEGVGASLAAFDPPRFLESQLGRPVDRDQILSTHQKRWSELSAHQPALPGVEQYIRDAKKLGLQLGVASNGTRKWVLEHLSRLSLLAFFDCIRCGEDIGAFKPDPDLYLSVLQILDIHPQQAIAFEDSPHGVLAAKQAGMYCVAVPNPAAPHLPLQQADLQLQSLSELPLVGLLDKANGHSIAQLSGL